MGALAIPSFPVARRIQTRGRSRSGRMSRILSVESNGSSSRSMVANTPITDATPSATTGSSNIATASCVSGISKCWEISKAFRTQSSQQRLPRRPLTPPLSRERGEGVAKPHPQMKKSHDSRSTPGGEFRDSASRFCGDGGVRPRHRAIERAQGNGSVRPMRQRPPPFAHFRASGTPRCGVFKSPGLVSRFRGDERLCPGRR